MKRVLFAVIFTLIGAGVALAQGSETIHQTTGTTFPTPTTITDWSPVSLFVQTASAVDSHPKIIVIIVANDGSTRLTFNYPDPSVAAFDTDAEVQTLINSLNTANMTTTSLWKRVFQRLCTDFPSKFTGGCSVP